MSSSVSVSGPSLRGLRFSNSYSSQHGTLTAEAYITAKNIVADKISTRPADIVILLDRSGAVGDNSSDIAKAACALIDKIGHSYSEDAGHSLSVIAFGSECSVLAEHIPADCEGVNAVREIINAASKSRGSVPVSQALISARAIVEKRLDPERRLAVVLFSGGFTGGLKAFGDCFSSARSNQREADSAVAAAAELKKLGATIYTVGAFGCADPAASYTAQKKTRLKTVWRSASKCINGLMHMISSDYGPGCSSWTENAESNDGRNCGHYLTVGNISALTRAFDEITLFTEESGYSVCPDESFVIREVLSEHFSVGGRISVYTAEYDAESGSFSNQKPFDATVDVSDKTVSVSGFCFSEHVCEAGSVCGQKLIVSIPVKEASNALGKLPVNCSGSGILDANGNMITFAGVEKAVVVNALDLSHNVTRSPDMEKLFLSIFGDTAYFKNLLPTMSSLRRIGSNIYLLDYQYEYDIDDLMSKGAASVVKLLGYGTKHILGGALKFRPGDFGAGCSAFDAKNENDDHIMGRNFDYMDGPCYVVWTHPKNAYAAISMVDGNFLLTFDRLKPKSTLGRFQSLMAPYLCLDGMNEKGLAIAVLQIHADGTKQDSGKIKMFTTAMIRICLDKCANVTEAIEMFSRFDVQDTIAMGYSLGCCFHYMLTDASGDAAVIEYVNNEMRVIRAGDKGFDKLFVTNYYLAPDGGVGMESYDPEGMERYDVIAETLAENNGVLNFAQTFDLLSDVHLNYRHNNNLYNITTLWSLLYNNNQNTMSLAARMDYSQIYTFSVTNPMRVYSIDSVDVKTPLEGNGYR